jgi:hypothetical protein
MNALRPILVALALASPAVADGFSHFGDFLLQAHFKLTGDRKTPIPMKSMAFRVYSDGVHVRIVAEDDNEARSTFEIYRSDGIARQRTEAGAIEVIPGIQATSRQGGVLRHLRLSRESFTITTFPGMSDQTIVSHAIAAVPRTPTDAVDAANNR